ncbi:MAG: energy transducer TonB [Desulfobacteraceae bacterium]|nr:MAG: energy transducer TonB [Desulfobacteraceae bacterium]
MSRLIFAAVLSFLLHGLLFTISVDRLQEKQRIRPGTRTVAVALSYKKPDNTPVAPKTHPIQQPPPAKPKQKTPKPRAVEKTVLTPIPPEPEAEPEESLSQEDEQPVREALSDDSPGKDVSTAHMRKEATPLYKDNPPPAYPRVARRRGHQGIVILEVLVSREGKVKDLAVYQSSGYASLDDAAKSSVWHWLFVPGMQGDQPVEMWVKLPVRFQLK